MPNKNFAFSTAGRILFGRGQAINFVPKIGALGRRILLVTGKNQNRIDGLKAEMEANGLEILVFPIEGEPNVQMIEAGLDVARRASVDMVISIGGGAAIDGGKAIAALVNSKNAVLDHLEVVGLGMPLSEPVLPFIAIPTTAGTGAEVTKNAVINVPEKRRKVSLRDENMYPDFAIVDASLMDNCPKSITLTSGLDAITQLIEPYICKNANPFTDALCRDAIPKSLRAIKTLAEGEDASARDVMAWASLCGGIALSNAGLGVVHGIAGPMGGMSSGAPHGAICAALLPYGLECNAANCEDEAMQKRFDEVLLWIADGLCRAPEQGFECLAKWSKEEGLAGLDALGITRTEREQAAQMASSSSSMRANPVSLNTAQLLELIERAR